MKMRIYAASQIGNQNERDSFMCIFSIHSSVVVALLSVRQKEVIL
jgi:hypothetical protein